MVHNDLLYSNFMTQSYCCDLFYSGSGVKCNNILIDSKEITIENSIYNLGNWKFCDVNVIRLLLLFPKIEIP